MEKKKTKAKVWYNSKATNFVFSSFFRYNIFSLSFLKDFLACEYSRLYSLVASWDVSRERLARNLPSRPIGTLRSDDGDGNGNATKAIGLISKTTILHVHHAFLYISLPSLHDYDVKMPNVTMYRGSTQATTRFPLSFWTWIWFVGIHL